MTPRVIAALAALTWLVWPRTSALVLRPLSRPLAAVAGTRTWEPTSWLARAHAAVLRRLGRLPGRELDAVAVLALVESLAPALEAGLPPSSAVELTGETRGSRGTQVLAGHSGAPSPGGKDAVLDAVLEAARAGEPLGPVWRVLAERTRSSELHLVAAAWTLSESSGAPLADALRTAAGVLRAATAQQRQLAAAVAGARATMNLLGVLPVAGPLVALALGIGPLQMYTTSVAAALSLALGLALGGLGRWWVSRLVAAVARGPVLTS